MKIFDLPGIILSNLYKAVTRIRVFNIDKLPQNTSVIFALIGRNEWTEGMTAMIINIGRRINVVTGNPINPDYFTTTKSSYKHIVENINNSLHKEFLRLEQEANNQWA